jgi:hypothetical protein
MEKAGLALPLPSEDLSRLLQAAQPVLVKARTRPGWDTITEKSSGSEQEQKQLFLKTNLSVYFYFSYFIWTVLGFELRTLPLAKQVFYP